MNCIIPFESKVKFNCPVKEICSISLEHEITKNDSEVLGNFLVSGTYKEHELSVNTSDFKFTIPFNVELTNRIENDSLEFSIDNFTYDVEGNEMKIMIDYIISADDVREDILLEEQIEDPIDLIEDHLVVPENINEPLIIEEEKYDYNSRDLDDDVIKNENIVQTIESNIINTNDENIAYVREEVNPEIVSGVETENDYMTYHIHIVKEEETIESIALAYKLTKDEIEKNNDISTLTKGDKLLIPINNE